MSEEALQIAVSGHGSVKAVRTLPDYGASGWIFIYAPGAGSNIHDPFGVYVCRSLAERGSTALRFQFPYAEAGRRRPDPPPVLEETWRSVVQSQRSPDARLVVGGSSMGGRIASQVAAKGAAIQALALFAYPLHLPGSPERRRDRHLPQIEVPTLFCSGTRDAFGSAEELGQAASLVPNSRLHLLKGADHGFRVLKSSGRTREDVWEEALATFLDWLDVI
jgi:predicted alpha/beta-hydrolase family hydrolase